MDYSPDVHTSFKFKQYNNGIRENKAIKDMEG